MRIRITFTEEGDGREVATTVEQNGLPVTYSEALAHGLTALRAAMHATWGMEHDPELWRELMEKV